MSSNLALILSASFRKLKCETLDYVFSFCIRACVKIMLLVGETTTSFLCILEEYFLTGELVKSNVEHIMVCSHLVFMER